MYLKMTFSIRLVLLAFICGFAAVNVGFAASDHAYPSAGVSQVTPEVIGHWGFSADEVPVPKWRAQWIWLPETADADPVDMLLARKTFVLSKPADRAILSVTASTQYQLWINGRYVCSGPARSAPHHQSYDILDVTRMLHKGKNAIAVRVHHQRDGVSYYDSSRAGLLVQLDIESGDRSTTIHTDASWRVSSDLRWLSDSPLMARFHLEVCDRMDLCQGLSEWYRVDYDDRSWAAARVLRREIGWPAPQPDDRPTHRIPPWTTLVPRDIPYLKEAESKAQRLVLQGIVDSPEDVDSLGDDRWSAAPIIPQIKVADQDFSPVETTEPITIKSNPQGKCQVLVYDLGEVQNGRPYLDIEAPAGTIVDIVAAPYLMRGNLQAPIVVSTYVDRIVLSGSRKRWEAFYLKPTRWLAVVFRNLHGGAKLYETGVIRSEYPFVKKGYFRTPGQPLLEKLWDASARTVEVCTTDAYTDNYRERRQYAQTSYYACAGGYPVFGDHALQRRYLMQIAQEQQADGLMPAYAPRHGSDFMVILDSNCFWLRGLSQYYLYSGDEATVRELLPAARKLIDLLHSYCNSDGLIDSPPHPYWLDHAQNDRRGANFCLNGHYLGALEDFKRILTWLGESDSVVYRERAERLRQSLREKFWDPQRKLFVDALIDGKRSDRFSEHAAAMAMAMKVASPEQMEAIATELTADDRNDFVHRESGVVMVTPAMSYFLHAGLCEAGKVEASLDLAQSRFSHMLAPKTNGTLWEEWWLDGTGRTGRFRPHLSGRSDAQTESAFFPELLAKYLLGIEPTQQGLREVVLRYRHHSEILQRSGAISTPTGLLEVAWDVIPAELNLDVNVPRSTIVKVDIAALAVPSLDRIQINSKPLSIEQVENGFIILRSGKYGIQVVDPRK